MSTVQRPKIKELQQLARALPANGLGISDFATRRITDALIQSLRYLLDKELRDQRDVTTEQTESDLILSGYGIIVEPISGGRYRINFDKAKLDLIVGKDSLIRAGLGMSLVNDDPLPGNNKVYGTGATGEKGWKDDPSGGGGTGYVEYTITNNTGSDIPDPSTDGAYPLEVTETSWTAYNACTVTLPTSTGSIYRYLFATEAIASGATGTAVSAKERMVLMRYKCHTAFGTYYHAFKPVIGGTYVEETSPAGVVGRFHLEAAYDVVAGGAYNKTYGCDMGEPIAFA